MIPMDPAALRRFHLLDIHDPAELGPDSTISARLRQGETANTYRLRDPARLAEPPGPLLTRLAGRSLGPHLHLACNADRHGVEARANGPAMPRVALSLMLRGTARVTPAAAAGGAPAPIVLTGSAGAVFHGDPGLVMESADRSTRMNLWVADALLDRMLRALLQDEPRGPRLRFHPTLDWSRGPGASLRRMLEHLVAELAEPDGGMTESPMAVAAFGELLADTMLRRLPHSHAAALERPVGAAAPRHLRRAEEFIEANAGRPVAMAEVAEAAGCSLRALHEAFRRFRDTTPHAAMLAARLDAVRAALAAGPDREAAPGAVARRFGFTNATRFATAYARRFGETPEETQWRSALPASRGGRC